MIRKTFNITGKRIAVLATALLFASLIIAVSSGASNAEYADPSVFSFSLDADGNPTYTGSATSDPGFSAESVKLSYYSDKQCRDPVDITMSNPGIYWVVATTVGLTGMPDVSSAPVEYFSAPSDFILPTEDSMKYIAVTVMLTIILIVVFVAVHARASV